MQDYVNGMIDIAKRAHELQVDVDTLRNTIDHLASTTKKVSESGNAVTISHTQTRKIGQTEIKLGNTEEAKTGKLSRSQTGQVDWARYYIFAGIAAVVLIAFLITGGNRWGALLCSG